MCRELSYFHSCLPLIRPSTSQHKCIGLSTCLVVLGIELDSAAQVARLPVNKLCALQALLHSWWGRRWCSRHKLECSLHHATKVVWPGRTFLR